MTCSPFRRVISYLLAFAQIMLSCMVFGLSPTHAQSLDTEPPRLEVDEVEEAGKGELQVFTATATDNQRIDSVFIFYRLESESAFEVGEMLQSGETDRYSFTLPAEKIAPSTSAIQYYVEAKDDAGNRVLAGFSFDPLERTLLDSSESLADANSEGATESTSILSSLSTGQKIVIGLAGVIVVGALVSAGGSSSGGNTSTGPTVPVTIIGEPIAAFR